MRGQPQKGVVSLGVNSLARETGLPKQTVSERMRKGQTADEIRIYASVRGRSAQKEFSCPAAPPKSAESQGAYELIVRGRERLEAIDSAKLRRALALAERGELDNMLRRGELVPVSYIRTWGTRFLVDARDTLMTGPSELQDTLAAEADPLKCAAIMPCAWVERA